MAEETPKTTQPSEETPKTTQPTATSKIVTQAKEYVGIAVEKAQEYLKPTTPTPTSEETPKTEAPKTDEKPAVAKEYGGAAVEKARGFLTPTTPVETPKTEASKTEKPAVALEATASEIGTHTKAYAEAAEAAAVKQADDIKSKVNEVTANEPEGQKKEDLKTKITTATRDALEGVGNFVKPKDHPSSTTSTTAPTFDEGVKKE